MTTPKGCLSSDALTALTEDRAEPRQRERALAHLASCARCQQARGRIASARAALRDIAEWAPPAPTAAGNARLEATLRWTRVEPTAQDALAFLPPPRRAVPRAAWVGLAAAAAVALAAVGLRVVPRGERGAAGPAVATTAGAPASAASPLAAAPVGPAERREAAVTLLGGDVRLVGLDGSERPLDPQRPLREGDHVVTGEGGRLAFQWGEGSGALLEGSGELRLSRLAPRAQELGLARGRIAVRVGPHQPGESMRVRAPDHDVTVHGTWFIVTVQPRGTGVDVLEGVVEVSAPTGDAASTRLPAPSHGSFLRGTGLASQERPLTGREAQGLRGAGEMGLLGWSSLQALFDGHGLLQIASEPPAQLVIDGVPFGASPLELRRPQGRHLVELSRAGFTTVRSWVAVGEVPGLLRADLQPEERRVAEVAPDADEVKQVMAARRAHIRACYERALKRDPELAGTITLALRIGGAGQVLGSSVGTDTLHDSGVIDCLRREASGWLFERARNATVEVGPFVFRAQ